MSGNTEKAEEGTKKGGKGMLIGILAVVLAGGGGAGWFFLKPKPDPDAEIKALYAPSAEPIFVNLDPFTVNLADEEDEAMAQVTIVLQMLNKRAEDMLKKNLPVVRNELLLLVSAQESKNIRSVKGKEKLAEDIADRAAFALGWEKSGEKSGDEKTGAGKKRPGSAASIPEPRPVVAVHFNQLLVQ